MNKFYYGRIVEPSNHASGSAGGISPNSIIPPSGGCGGISTAEAAANLKKLTHKGCSTMDKTLRDEIAIEAMKVLMVMPDREMLAIYGHANISQAAYQQADSMLLARSKKDN